MRLYGLVFVSLLVPSACLADYVCPPSSDVCSYVVNTGETDKVGAGGGGKTADKAEWIIAPDGKYLVNGKTRIVSQNGRAPVCNIEKMDGTQTRKIQGITVVLHKKYLVRARVETGSGMQNVGRTAHMQCGFDAEVVSLPN
ncbi:hypothetical protein [uncultured Alsobacter sp.]|uniref:hypothetical protein n=1 Tax=uncultured Alsobacter sp. TaxID=1748258 RepID=UPI0025EE89E0|nr:hypothetical protein [uncultured Alsobacter sp.]